MSMFRTFLYEAVAARFEKEKYDDLLENTVKGRYISAVDVYKNSTLKTLVPELIKGILKNYSFGLYKGGNF